MATLVYVQRSVFECTVLAEFNALYGERTAAFADIVDDVIADVMVGDADKAALDQQGWAAASPSPKQKVCDHSATMMLL